MSQNQTIVLPSRITPDVISRLFGYSLAEIGRISTHIAPNFSIGSESSLIQWLINWSLAAPTRIVHFVSDPIASERIAQTPYLSAIGLCATALSSEGTSEQELSTKFFRRARSWLTGSQPDLFTLSGLTNGYSLFSLDSSDIPYPEQLYRKDGDNWIVRDLDHFEHLFQDFTTQSDSFVPIFGRTEQVGIEHTDLPRVVFELFKNTHDHARTTVSGERLPFSLRGVYLRLHSGLYQTLADDADSVVDRYLRRLQESLSLSDNSNITLLEISVLDSGPGLAAHRAHKFGAGTPAPNPMTEQKWFEECFVKFSTGLRAEANRGLGLDEVQRSVSAMNGCMFVRSGSLFVFRDFIHTPFDGKVRFRDMASKGQVLATYKKAEGALFTVLIPCKHLS